MLLPNLTAALPVQWLKRLGINDILGVVKVEDWDYIHTAIFCDEMSRSGLTGPGASLTTGMAFGVPPLLKFGSQDLQERSIPELLLGKKRTCIAITEPGAGSDVAGIETTAEKTEDGKTLCGKWDEEMDHKRDMVALLHYGCSYFWAWPCRSVSYCGSSP